MRIHSGFLPELVAEAALLCAKVVRWQVALDVLDAAPRFVPAELCHGWIVPECRLAGDSAAAYCDSQLSKHVRVDSIPTSSERVCSGQPHSSKKVQKSSTDTNRL